MTHGYVNEPMLEMYIFEAEQLISQLEQIILLSEKDKCFSNDAVNDIFRIMHTIKGSSSMMMFNDISTLAHKMEDVFFLIREEKPKEINCEELSELLLNCIDFIKDEIEKLKLGADLDGDSLNLVNLIKDFLNKLEAASEKETSTYAREEKKDQQFYIMKDKSLIKTYENAFKAKIDFIEDCEMENIRAYTIIHNIDGVTKEFYHFPEDLIADEEAVDTIRRDGFILYLQTNYSYDEMHNLLMKTIFLKNLQLDLISREEYEENKKQSKVETEDLSIKEPEIAKVKSSSSTSHNQNIISVSVSKLDQMMDLVGEIVIAEEMVVQNPDLQDLELENFQKAARHLSKVTSEMQSLVMSIRMVPLSSTFIKMYRIVRDMSKKLDKEVELEILGENTEVDKNIIEHISDPLMHLVRNALDHGIESSKEREKLGKDAKGTIVLEAKNAGRDVIISIKDDGKGLDADKIYKKAFEKELISKDRKDMTDKEIFNLILLPGFSTKENVSEFSGRGVGMDVVTKSIESIAGTVNVDSVLGQGMVITLKIPLTLAIISGMNLKVGKSRYTIPTLSIKESFRPSKKDVIIDPDNNEMVMVRGKCYRLIRLHKQYKIQDAKTNILDGIIIMLEQDNEMIGIFADELLGQQQVVVKSLPPYIQKIRKIKGLAGCTLLGDGSVSLILDVAEVYNM